MVMGGGAMKIIIHEEDEGKFTVIDEEEIDSDDRTLLTCEYPGRQIFDVHFKPEMVCIYLGVVLQ